MTVRLKFCGAAGTVTGSCTWVTYPGGQFLVDCGMFQGPKTLKELNYGPFPFDPAAIDFLLLTHAHIDHAGLVPKLVKAGFAGPIYATAGSRDLLTFMLPDSGFIQEREVELLNRRNVQRGRPAVTPIYTAGDAEAAMAAFRTIPYGHWADVGRGVRARWWNAGHILGAGSIELEVTAGKPAAAPLRLLFSGDIGPDNKLFHPDPDAPSDVDLVVCESTYGDRSRPDVNPERRRRLLAEEVNEAMAAGGVLLIPAFAVERTQELLADLSALIDAGNVPRVPVFLDSPLAIRATEVFAAHARDLEDLGGRGGGGSLLRHPNFHFTETVEQSKAIDRFSGRIIVLAASGMCEAGRIRHHLKRFLWQPNATVLLVGYQATGTLGNLLQQGTPAVRIMGEDVTVRARIRTLDVYSGHADAEELVAWVEARRPIRRGIVLVHGEEAALEGLRGRLAAAGHAHVLVPGLDDEIELAAGGDGIVRRRAVTHRLPPEAVARPDWHNDLAQFSIDLRTMLEGAADAKGRAVILRRLRRALAEPASSPSPRSRQGGRRRG